MFGGKCSDLLDSIVSHKDLVSVILRASDKDLLKFKSFNLAPKMFDLQLYRDTTEWCRGILHKVL